MNDLLIITNSYDITTDLLLDRLEGKSVFRLNFDQITAYQIKIDTEGFTIFDPTGRFVSSSTVKKAYWRKPFNAESAEQGVWTKYVDAEMRYMLAELVNLLWSERKFVLVEPYAERRTGKLLQLYYARNFFEVPNYEFVLNRMSSALSTVVKSLSNERVDDNVIYTTKARAQDLDPRFPWFIQHMVTAKEDVTIVFVRGQIFAFSLERDFLDKSVDWRQFISPEQRWKSHSIPGELQEAILQYMKILRLDYGRLDFLLDADNSYWFCEVNPNGQFAWLDLHNEYGMLETITQEISPANEVYSIPNPHPLG